MNANNQLNNINNDAYKGFALFSDIEDETLRARNRAVVLANIAEDFSKDKRISPAAASLILGYFRAVPEGERAATKASFVNQMNSRGFKIVSA